ncbi:MAG: gamma-glutamyl-gamma-aminobutyrate hydrolase family protein [Actinomycetota bacterium]
MPSPLVLIVGRQISETKGLRTSGFGAGDRYQHALVRSGAVPLILPPIVDLVDDVRDLVGRCDAVVLHGGGDIDPARYGRSQETDHLYGVNEAHDAVEHAIVRAVIDLGKPMLAICRGHQMLNVVCGGTLIQHLDLPGHREQSHPVELDAGSRAALAMGSVDPQSCYSFHHQAVDELGDGLVVSGRSIDGVVEAIEWTGPEWIVGVQWHPEDTADQDPQQQALFDALVRVAS